MPVQKHEIGCPIFLPMYTTALAHPGGCGQVVCPAQQMPWHRFLQLGPGSYLSMQHCQVEHCWQVLAVSIWSEPCAFRTELSCPWTIFVLDLEGTPPCQYCLQCWELGAGSRSSFELAEQHPWKWCSSPALLECYCFISSWGPWCAHESRQSSKLVRFTLSHLHCLYNSEWFNEFRTVCGNRGKCVIIYIFIHSQVLALSLFTLSIILSSLYSWKIFLCW